MSSPPNSFDSHSHSQFASYRPPSASSGGSSFGAAGFLNNQRLPSAGMLKMQSFQNGSNNSSGGGYGGYHPFQNTFLPHHQSHNHHGPTPGMHLNNTSHLHQNINNGNTPASFTQPPHQTAHREEATRAPISNNPQRIKELEYASISRAGASPHHHARAAHLQRRGHSTLSVIDTKDILPTLPSTRKSGKSSKGEDEMRTIKPVRPPTEPEKEIPEGERTWSTLDMGGMQLKRLTAPLFAYTFLTALYIPHNQLSALPVELCRLSALIRLDASSNKLSTVPPDFGTLTSLREFFLFDNQISSLPSELGTLYMLDILGLEGNPLPDSLKTIAEKEGTTGLMAFLRDSCPVPMPPPDREWIAIDAEDAEEVPTADNGDQDRPQDGFSVLCYNILCEKMATPQMYGYTPSWALSWEYRKELILQEIMGYAADILCLQEVDMEQYEEYFQHNLSQQDYEGVYWPRSRARTMSDEEKRHVDGEAIFYKATTFSLVEQQLIEFNQIAMRRPDFKKTEDMFNRVMTKDHVAVVALLEHRTTGARLVVANAHIEWRADFKDVKLVQVAMMMDEIERIADRFARLPPRLDIPNAPTYGAGNGRKIPTIICGDYNSLPDSGVHEFFSKGSIKGNHADFGDYIYGNFTSEGLSHSLSLKSAYASINELPFTNYTPGFKGVIDYIWYSTNTLAVTGVLGEVDQPYLTKVVGFPNAHYPSDHICLFAEFKQRRPLAAAR